jgi:hypothetical protein
MAREAPRRGSRRQDTVKHGYGDTFENAVKETLSPAFRRGEAQKRAEVILTEILIGNPEVTYHVVVRFPEN